MNRTIFSMLLLLSAGLFSCKNNSEKQLLDLQEPETVQAPVPGERFNIEAPACDIIWEGRKLTKKHRGTLQAKEGYVIMENGQLKGGEIVIDMSTIRDMTRPDENNEDLEQHLKSADFFDVENHPFASFIITKTATYIGEDDMNTLIYGNLTIKGITKSTQLKANVEPDANSVLIKAPLFHFDRAEFDIRYDSSSFFDDLGDKAIDDEIGLDISIQAFK